MKSLTTAAFVACFVLCAQSSGQQVAGRVIDAITGQGVGEASVTLYTSAAERYGAGTDNSGNFRLDQIEKGRYEVAIQKSGFVLFAKEPLEVGEGIANPTYALTFATEPKVTLKGRILNSEGKPVANATVDLIRGPSLGYRRIADSEGRFSFENLGTGGYKLRAAPPADYPGFEVATYFPGWVDESAAGQIQLKSDAQVEGFRLATSPGVHLRGIVRDDDNNPVANALVQLLPVQRQPAHVVVSFDSTFLAIPAGNGTGPAEAELKTGADGAFDFPSVRIGGWKIVAGTEGLSGSAPVSVTNEDVQMDVQIKAPATISSLPVTWTAWECTSPLIEDRCSLNSRKAPEGVGYPIWFQAVDGQASVLRFLTTGRDSTSDLMSITPGRFVPVPLPVHGLLTLPKDGHLGSTSSFPSIRQLDSKGIVQGQPVDLDRGSRDLELSGGGYFDGDPALPRMPAPQPGKLRGTVINGPLTVVVIAHEERGHIWGELVQCGPDGAFAMDAISILGDYRVAAFLSMDLERLRDPSVLEKVLSSGTKVRISESATAEVRISQLF